MSSRASVDIEPRLYRLAFPLHASLRCIDEILVSSVWSYGISHHAAGFYCDYCDISRPYGPFFWSV